MLDFAETSCECDIEVEGIVACYFMRNTYAMSGELRLPCIKDFPKSESYVPNTVTKNASRGASGCEILSANNV